MTKKLMQLGKRKKKKEKWHDTIEDDSSRAKVWPARAVEQKNKDDVEGLDHLQLTNTLMKVLAGISFAEALHDSSTLYGVSVRKNLPSPLFRMEVVPPCARESNEK